MWFFLTWKSLKLNLGLNSFEDTLKPLATTVFSKCIDSYKNQEF